MIRPPILLMMQLAETLRPTQKSRLSQYKRGMGLLTYGNAVELHRNRTPIPPFTSGKPFQLVRHRQAGGRGSFLVKLRTYANDKICSCLAFPFSHPDYTVGLGISPSPPATDACLIQGAWPPHGSRTESSSYRRLSSPPVGNFTLPRRFQLCYF